MLVGTLLGMCLQKSFLEFVVEVKYHEKQHEKQLTFLLLDLVFLAVIVLVNNHLL